MVNIVRRTAVSSVVDDQALHAFRYQWELYSKLVDHDYLCHRAVRTVLHRELAAEADRPFRFLDLACGDARLTVAALAGTSVKQYRGIDLSTPALAMAQQTAAALACPAELEQDDFVTAVRARPKPAADVVWIGLALHHLHTPDKQSFMRDVRAAVDDGGRFMIYEPVSREGESRAEYLDRFERTNHSAWTALTADEWAGALTHVRTADYPEAPSVWTQLGRDAGFSSVRELFSDPNDLYAVFCFQP